MDTGLRELSSCSDRCTTCIDISSSISGDIVAALGRVSLCMVLLSCLLVGCASVRLVARESDPYEKEILVEKCGWSLDMEGGKTEIRVAQRETIGAVKVHSNFLYALGTVLSLGHWIPFQITYEVNQNEQTH